MYSLRIVCPISTSLIFANLLNFFLNYQESVAMEYGLIPVGLTGDTFIAMSKKPEA